MNLKYKIKKAWFGFWQKYKLEVHLKIAAKLFLIFLMVWIIGSIFTILSQWIFISKDATPFHLENIEYFWTVIIELVSGFDVPGEKLHLVSKIISVIILMTGIVIIAIFTGQIVSMFVHVLQRAHHLPEKPDNFKFKRPIIICGVNEKLYPIIEELKRSVLARGREIIIVDHEADKIKVKTEKNLEISGTPKEIRQIEKSLKKSWEKKKMLLLFFPRNRFAIEIPGTLIPKPLKPPWQLKDSVRKPIRLWNSLTKDISPIYNIPK